MSEDRMKPCPFCGGEAERIDIPTDDEMDENAGGSCIQCNRCAASTALHFDRKENLVSSWNDRVVDRSGNEFVKRLRDRALFAREEDTATATSDALHFEEAAERLNALTARVAELEDELRISQSVVSEWIARGVELDVEIAKLRTSLIVVRAAIIRAPNDIITDTVWMPEEISMNETVVDFIDATLEPEA